MLRGRKRKLPSFFVPEPYYHGSESEEDHLQGVGEHVEPVVPAANPQDVEEDYDVQQEQLQPEHAQDFEQNGEEINQQEEEDHDHLHQEEENRELVQEPEDWEMHQEEEDLDPIPEEDNNLIQEEEDDLILEQAHELFQEQPHELFQEEENHAEQEEQEEEDEEEEEEEEEQEEEEEEDPQDYQSILDSLSEKWIIAEADHTISNVASNTMWKLAFSFIPKLLEAKALQNVKRKVPQFNHIRKCIHKKRTPQVDLEIAYQNKTTEEIQVVQDTVTPKSRFPPNAFKKVYEIATVKVKKEKLKNDRLLFSFSFPAKIDAPIFRRTDSCQKCTAH